MPRSFDLNRLAHFAAVVEEGSFTAAAARLGVGKALVSQHVARLEAEVGAALVLRTSRRVQPTEAGLIFHASCRTILAEADAAVALLTESRSVPTGLLRLTAPADLGASVVASTAARFVSLYPACRVDMRLTDLRLDPMREAFDLSIRAGWLRDSGLRTRRLAPLRQVLVAAPGLAGLAALSAPDGLGIFPWVTQTVLPQPLRWTFRRGRESLTVIVAGRIGADSTPAVHRCVLAGGGMSVLPHFVVNSDIATGRLVALLPDWQLPEGGVHAVMPATRFRPARVEAFLELLVKDLRAAQ